MSRVKRLSVIHTVRGSDASDGLWLQQASGGDHICRNVKTTVLLFFNYRLNGKR